MLWGIVGGAPGRPLPESVNNGTPRCLDSLLRESRISTCVPAQCAHGGADPAAGSGLRGLADRVEALGGRLRIISARGRGTTVRAEIPCGPTSLPASERTALLA